ncbi:hypothetical protein ABT294_23115 [Nonomuraea sp. NPDC000554]|uniref:hypothetical protein n=1 Tax=Nonomuraea sp. NPDC000554 TaxID=3154259 RepID=UPI00332DB5C2
MNKGTLMLARVIGAAVVASGAVPALGLADAAFAQAQTQTAACPFAAAAHSAPQVESDPDPKKVARWKAAEDSCVEAFQNDTTARGEECRARYDKYFAPPAPKVVKENASAWRKMSDEKKDEARRQMKRAATQFHSKCCPKVKFQGM